MGLMQIQWRSSQQSYTLYIEHCTIANVFIGRDTYVALK